MAEPQEETNPNSSSKRWMCTVFSDVWVPTFTSEMLFAVWQREVCPETNRLHVHIYVRFARKKKMTTVKHLFGREDMHLELCRGNEEECTRYCEKEETRYEVGARHNPENYIGHLGTQGHRSDLDAVAAMIDQGEPLVEVARAFKADYIRYHMGIQAYHALVAPKPPTQRDVVTLCFWGPTGTGKTHRVMTSCPDCYQVKPGRDPWGGYRGEDCIFFDEFDYKRWPIDDMKRYLDTWRPFLDSRYHDRYGAWTRVAICANTNPQSWYPDASPPDLEAFRRRLAHRCFLITSRDDTFEQIQERGANPDWDDNGITTF